MHLLWAHTLVLFMQSRRLLILSILLAVFILASLPGIAYIAGLALVHGRPAPADPAQFSQETIATAWHQCRENIPVAVQPINPWLFAGKFLFGNPLQVTPGERAAWLIASTHNETRPTGSNLRWHTSGAALTIWITRNWSAEQIGATLAQSNLCTASD